MLAMALFEVFEPCKPGAAFSQGGQKHLELRRPLQDLTRWFYAWQGAALSLHFESWGG